MPTTERPIRIIRLAAALAIVLAVLAANALGSPEQASTRAEVATAGASEPDQIEPDKRLLTAPPSTTTTTAPPPPPTTTTTEAPQPPHSHEAAPEPSPAPEQPAAASSASGDPYSDAAWDRLAQCESGGDWSINTGNGYYGGIQFSLGSWQGVGGTGLPSDATRQEQITRGRLLWEQGGWAHWPACTRSFGWR